MSEPRSAARPVQGSPPVLVTDLASKTLAVKEGDTFLYCDLEGNLDHGNDYGLGLYSRDTRYLSRLSHPPAPEAPSLRDRGVEFACVGADGQTRRTVVAFALVPDRLEVVGGLVTAVFRLHLGPYQTRLVGMTIEPVAEALEAPL